MEFLFILIIIASILLVGIVLIQNSKGGGLDSNIASQSQAFGAQKTTEIVEKITWWLAGALIIFSIVSTKIISSSVEDGDIDDGTEQYEGDEEEDDNEDEG